MTTHTGCALGVNSGDRIFVGKGWYTVNEITFTETHIIFHCSKPLLMRQRKPRIYQFEFRPLDDIIFQTTREW